MQSSSPRKVNIYQPEKGADELVIIRAGAGAGKTTELITRVISYGINFYKTHHYWPKVILTTFTIKATEEIRERILKSIHQLAGDFSHNKIEELYDWCLSSKVFITTIHGLALKFIRQYGYNIGLFSEFSIANQEKTFFNQFLKNQYFENKTITPLFDSLLNELSFQDLEEILHELILLKIAYKDIYPYQSAWDIQKWQKEFNKTKDELTTLIKITKSLNLKTPSQINNLNKYQELISATINNSNELAAIISNLGLSKRNKLGPKEYHEEFDAIFDQLKYLSSKDWDIEVSKLSEHITKLTYDLVTELFDKYFLFIKQEQKISLKDIEPLSLFLIENYPFSFQDFSRQWNYWYIDEFQDTSPIQMDLLKKLMGNKNGFFVGDPQQSIYLFRGSDYKIFLNQFESIKQLGGNTYYLNKNYRSSPKVLSFINQAIQQFKENEFTPMELGNSQNIQGYVNITSYNYKDLNLKYSDIRKQWLIANIIEHIEALKHETHCNYGEICILCPENKYLITIAEGLKKSNIPFQLHAPGSFYNSKEVLQSITLLRFLINPHDNENFIALIQNDVLGIHTRDLKKFFSKESFWLEFKKNNDYPEIILLLENCLQKIHSQGIFETWVELIYEIGLLDYYKIQDESGLSENNLWKFISIIQKELKNPNFNWNLFFHHLLMKIYYGSEEKTSVSDIESNRVQLMTIHASKGLEFNYVIFPIFKRKEKLDLIKKIYIDTKTLSFAIKSQEGTPIWAKEIEKNILNLNRSEKERLWYVAVTRAKNGIILPLLLDQNDKDNIDNASYSNEKYTPTYENINFYQSIATSIKIPFISKDLNIIESTIIETSSRTKYKIKNLKPLNNQNIEIFDHLNSSWETLESKFMGVFVHKHLEELIKKKIFSKVLTNSTVEIKYHWIKKFIPDIQDRLEHSFSEWGYALMEKDDKIKRRRIDLWGINHSLKKLWIIDFKTGKQTNLNEAFAQLTEYGNDLMMMFKIPHDYLVELILVLTAENHVEIKLLK